LTFFSYFKDQTLSPFRRFCYQKKTTILSKRSDFLSFKTRQPSLLSSYTLKHQMCNTENRIHHDIDSISTVTVCIHSCQSCNCNKRDYTICCVHEGRYMPRFDSLFREGFKFSFLLKIFVDVTSQMEFSSFCSGPCLSNHIESCLKSLRQRLSSECTLQ